MFFGSTRCLCLNNIQLFIYKNFYIRFVRHFVKFVDDRWRLGPRWGNLIYVDHSEMP
jgi:hypothetical protein